MKKILIGLTVLLSLSVVGCSKKYTEEEIEDISERYEQFEYFVFDFRDENLFGNPSPLDILLTEIKENEGIVNSSIIEDTTKRIANIRDDLNSYDIKEFKDILKSEGKNNGLDNDEINKSVQQIDLFYGTVNGILDKYTEINNLGIDGRYNSAEIDKVEEIIKEINLDALNTLEEERREKYKELMKIAN